MAAKNETTFPLPDSAPCPDGDLLFSLLFLNVRRFTFQNLSPRTSPELKKDSALPVIASSDSQVKAEAFWDIWRSVSRKQTLCDQECSGGTH
jgi:hypothetical protein